MQNLNKVPSTKESQDLVHNFVAFTLARGGRPDIELLLKKNGVDVPAKSSDSEIITILYSALPKSKSLQHDLKNYFSGVYYVENAPGGVFAGFVDELGIETVKSKNPVAPYSDNFNGKFVDDVVKFAGSSDFHNADGGGFFSKIGNFFKGGTADQKAARVTETNPQGKTKAGLAIQSVASKENISNLLNTGIGLLSNKLSAQADQKTLAAATQNEAARAARLAEEEKANLARKEATRAWVVPVVIGVVVIGLAVGAYFVFKKKK